MAFKMEQKLHGEIACMLRALRAQYLPLLSQHVTTEYLSVRYLLHKLQVNEHTYFHLDIHVH